MISSLSGLACKLLGKFVFMAFDAGGRRDLVERSVSMGYVGATGYSTKLTLLLVLFTVLLPFERS